MKREIKFRAWDTIENKWLFGYEMPNLGGFSLIGEVVLMGQLNTISLERWNDVVIMQYTGLKDKNGVEIYEGDILQYYAHRRISGNYSGDVFYEDGQWSIRGYHLCGFLLDNGVTTWCEVTPHFEVIGNIYQNPELLNQTI